MNESKFPLSFWCFLHRLPISQKLRGPNVRLTYLLQTSSWPQHTEHAVFLLPWWPGNTQLRTIYQNALERWCQIMITFLVKPHWTHLISLPTPLTSSGQGLIRVSGHTVNKYSINAILMNLIIILGFQVGC